VLEHEPLQGEPPLVGRRVGEEVEDLLDRLHQRLLGPREQEALSAEQEQVAGDGEQRDGDDRDADDGDVEPLEPGEEGRAEGRLPDEGGDGDQPDRGDEGDPQAGDDDGQADRHLDPHEQLAGRVAHGLPGLAHVRRHRLEGGDVVAQQDEHGVQASPMTTGVRPKPASTARNTSRAMDGIV
jgi:hypothetical protein